MALDKLKKFLGTDEGNDTSVEGEYYSEEGDMDIPVGSNKMILLEPRAFSESQQIADYLKHRHAVVVNLKRVTPDQAKRIVDFLSGTLYAIGGDLQKLGGGIFLCTPKNVIVDGKISDEKEVAAPKKSNKKVTKDDEEEFNW